MDALSEVLGSVRLKSSIFTRSVAGAPWGISLQAKAMVRLHYVVQGGGWLSADTAPGPLALATGDLVVLPLGDAHALHDQPRRRVRSLEQMLESTEQTAGALLLKFGGTGPWTTIISGCLEFENPTGRLLTTLPRVIRITPEEGRAVPWLERNLQFIEAEASSNRPGAQLVLARIAEVIFVQALRAHGAGRIIGIENDHGVVARAVHVHRVVNIDEALRIFADTVGVAISDLRRQFTPVVDHFVDVFTAPNCGICAAGFVGSCKHHARRLNSTLVEIYVGASVSLVRQRHE